MRLLCVQCRHITADLTADQLAQITACPDCGQHGSRPADADDQVTVSLTRHELRILTMWAQNYARSIGAAHPSAPATVQGIVDGLGCQTDTALTLSQEIADLRAEFTDVTVFDATAQEG